MNANTQDPKERRREIAAVLNAWLDRYVQPRGLSDTAAQAESNALLTAVAGRLPARDWREPLARALAHHDRIAQTRAWPMVREIHDAISAAEPRQVPTSTVGEAACPGRESLRRLASRLMADIPDGLKAPLPIPENLLYGVSAVAVDWSGAVQPEMLRAARSRAYFARKESYGEAAARVWELDRLRHHADAEAAGTGDPLIRAAVEGCSMAEARKRINAERDARKASEAEAGEVSA